MAHIIIQPEKGKKITYKDLPKKQIKKHGNGIVETRELGEVTLSSWDVVENIPIQERIESDGSKKYYIPMMLEWSTQYTDQELMQLLKDGIKPQFFYVKAFYKISEKVKDGEFIPADKG